MRVWIAARLYRLATKPDPELTVRLLKVAQALVVHQIAAAQAQHAEAAQRAHRLAAHQASVSRIAQSN